MVEELRKLEHDQMELFNHSRQSALVEEVKTILAAEADAAREPPPDADAEDEAAAAATCLLYTSPSPRDRTRSRMPSSA